MYRITKKMTPEQDNDCFGHCNGGKKLVKAILH